MKAWRKRPGSFDPLHAENVFAAHNAYGIPDLLPQPTNLTPPKNLFAYHYRAKIRTTRPILLHFHIDDYRFEAAWNEPSRSLLSVARPQVWAACSPDFSLWLRYPLAMQLWNTYRNRWLARYWQDAGITIIPSVNWSSPDSYNFCFAGIPERQIVTLRSYRSARGPMLENYINGYHAARQAIQPRTILWFGDVPARCDTTGIEIIQFAVGHWEA